MFGLSGLGGWQLNDYTKHLSHFFKSQGYETALAGIQHEDLFPPVNLAYDHTMNITTSVEQRAVMDRFVIVDAALEYLSQSREKPFFMSIGIDSNHHHRWEETNSRLKALFGKPDARYTRPLPPLPDIPEARQETAEFYSSIRYADYQLGRLMQTLRETNLEKDTIILFTTDHGIGLPHIKLNLTDAGCGVAMMLRFPDGFAKGKVIDDLVTQLDVYPTICDMFNFEKPQWLEGKSLMPLINGGEGPLHEEIYLQQNSHGNRYAPLRAVRSARYKYVKRYGDESSRAHFNADGGLTYNVLCNSGYKEMEFPEEQLFDLYFDTNEVNNIIDLPQYRTIADEMRQKLETWQKTKNDPALSGTIPRLMSDLM
jgi:arylsulfatase A-like enzyme